MKTINKLTFTTLAALAATLLFQTLVTRADEHGQRDEHGQQAMITFTKRTTASLNQPGLIATMAGGGGGDAGTVAFTGEILQSDRVSVPGVAKIVALYHFTGTEHSFSALVHVVQPLNGLGSKGTIIGVVTDGWLRGHALEGEYTVVAPCGLAGIGNCFEVTLAIARDSRDSIDN